MTPNEIRTILLGEHAELRPLIDLVRQIALRLGAGEPLRGELRASALRLSDALSTHNASEENLLRGATNVGGIPIVLENSETMSAQHFGEHKALHVALVEVNLDPSDRLVAKGVIAALDRVLDHMAREEEELAEAFDEEEEDTEPG